MINGMKIEEIGELEIRFETEKGTNGQFYYDGKGEVYIDVEEFYCLAFCDKNLIREIFPKEIKQGEIIEIDGIKMKIKFIYMEEKL